MQGETGSRILEIKMACLLMLRRKACDKGLVVFKKDHGAGYTVTNLKLCPHKNMEVACADLDAVEVAVDNYDA